MICLFLGIWAAFFFSKRNYNPVGKIVGIIQSISKPESGKKFDEYNYIESSLKGILDERNKMTYSLDKQNKLLKNNFISRLFKGYINNKESYDDLCRNYNINFSGSYFVVMLFYIEDIGNVVEENSSNASGDSVDLAHFIITNVAEELISEKHTGFVTEMEQMPVCLINISHENLDSVRDDLMSIAMQLKDFLATKYNMSISIGVSRIHESFLHIHNAYKESLEVMEFGKLLDSCFVMHYDSMKSGNGTEELDDFFKNDIKFSNCISTGDFGEAGKVLSRIFDESFNNKAVSIHFNKSYIDLPRSICAIA